MPWQLIVISQCKVFLVVKNREISSQIQKLRFLLSKEDIVKSADLDLQAHWAKYLCILTSGLIENSIKITCLEYCSHRAHPQVLSYCTTQLNQIQNPKTQKLVDIVRMFNKSWSVELEVYSNEAGRKDAIDSIMNNRHQIAHGKDVGLTIHRVKDYLDKSIEVIDFIENKFNP